MNTAQYMPPIAFDTLAYANKLKAVGIEPKIAETQAELQASVLSELINNQVATKKDLLELKFELKQEITNLDIKVSKLKDELLTKLGGMIIACTALIGTFIALLPHFH